MATTIENRATPPAGHNSKPAAAPPPPKPKPAENKPQDGFEPGKKSLNKLADKDFAKLDGGNPKPGPMTSAVLKDVNAHEEDKNYGAEMVANLAKTGDLNSVISHLPEPTKHAMTGFRGVATTTDDHGVPQFLDGVARAEDKGRIDPKAVLSEAAKHPNNYGWQQVAQKSVDAGSDAINGAKSNYDKALSAKEQADQKLNQELAVTGGGLDAKQRQAYIDAYHGKHKDVYADERQSSAHLDAELKQWGPALEEAARTGVPKDAYKHLSDVSKGYESLAKSSHAEDALKWASRTVTDQHLSSLYAKDDHKFTDKVENVLTDGLQHGTAEALANNKGNGKAAAEEIRNILGPIKTAASVGKGLFGLKNLGDGLKNFRHDLEDGYQTFDKLSRGETTALKELQGSWDKKSKLGKSMAAAGLALGVASAGNDVAKGKFGDAVVQLAGKSQQIAELTARALGTYAEAGKIAAGAAGRGAEFLARFAPGLGVLASGVSLYLDGKAALHGDPGAVVSVVGDAISAVGSAVELIPGVGTVVGGLINGIGGAVSFLGSALDAVLGLGHHGQSKTSEEHELLKKIGLSEPVAQALSHADPKMLKSLRQAVQGAADPAKEMQQILGKYPEFAFKGLPGPAYQLVNDALDLANRLGVKGGKLDEFLNHLSSAGSHMDGMGRDAWGHLVDALDHVHGELKDLGDTVSRNHPGAQGAKFDQIFNPKARALLEKEFPWLKALLA